MSSYDRNERSAIASDFTAHERRVLGGTMKRHTATNPGINDGKREQEVLTPPEIIVRVERAFGGLIGLDPCSPSKNAPSFHALRRYHEHENGLDLPWFDRTFFNPPWDVLRPWLEKAEAEAKDGKRIVGLVPWRSRRLWFQRALASSTAATLEGPVKFVGHKAAIPVDVTLIAWNCVVPGHVFGSFVKGE